MRLDSEHAIGFSTAIAIVQRLIAYTRKARVCVFSFEFSVRRFAAILVVVLSTACFVERRFLWVRSGKFLAVVDGFVILAQQMSE